MRRRYEPVHGIKQSQREHSRPPERMSGEDAHPAMECRAPAAQGPAGGCLVLFDVVHHTACAEQHMPTGKLDKLVGLADCPLEAGH